MRIALVHDYLAQDGGAERVLKALHEIWPKAPIFVLFYDKNKITNFSDADIRQSFISKLPFHKNHYQWYLPFMPLATERHNLNDFDLVISSASAFAKGVLTGPNTLHISYCHTPTRYLWTDTHEYISELKYNFLIKSIIPRLIHKMRIWDKMSAERVDFFIANSNTVKQRIQKFYRKDSTVIYPPVDVNNFYISKHIGDYFLAGGRIASYKRFDMIIQVFNRLGWPLKIFGTGPRWWNSLQKISKPNIEFLGRVSDQEKSELYSKARAFIYPQVEDFGIMAVESMASGRPVIAYGVGGATETVVPGQTGLFLRKQTWEELLDVLLKFDSYKWDSEKIREHALKFSEANFKNNIKQFVDQKYQEFKNEIKQEKVIIK